MRGGCRLRLRGAGVKCFTIRAGLLGSLMVVGFVFKLGCY